MAVAKTNHHTRNEQYKSQAKALAHEFFPKSTEPTSNWNGKNDWNILENRIDNPQNISQGQTNTCGPAAFWYALAYYRPDKYAKAIGELYTKGETQLGNIKLKPNKKVLKSWEKGEHIEFIDWMALVSLKNSTINLAIIYFA